MGEEADEKERSLKVPFGLFINAFLILRGTFKIEKDRV